MNSRKLNKAITIMTYFLRFNSVLLTAEEPGVFSFIPSTGFLRVKNNVICKLPVHCNWDPDYKHHYYQVLKRRHKF